MIVSLVAIEDLCAWAYEVAEVARPEISTWRAAVGVVAHMYGVRNLMAARPGALMAEKAFFEAMSGA